MVKKGILREKWKFGGKGVIWRVKEEVGKKKNGEFGGKMVVKKKGGFLEKKAESGEK